MKVFTYSEARQNLSKLLNMAQTEEIEIRRKDGTVYSVKAKIKSPKSPFDVPGIQTKAFWPTFFLKKNNKTILLR